MNVVFCLFIASAFKAPPLKKELVDYKMLPVSAKLVIGFRRSSAEIGENLWAIWFPVWCKQKGSAKWIGVLEVSNLRSLPCSVPAEDVSASPSCRQRHNSNRWWRVWNRFVLFHLTCLCVQGPTLWITCFSSTKSEWRIEMDASKVSIYSFCHLQKDCLFVILCFFY